VARLTAMLGGLIAYLCIGTVLAQLIIVGFAVARGWLNKQKLVDIIAVARGATLSSAEQKAPEKPAQNADMPSVAERDQRNTTKMRHLELREQAVKNEMEQIATERDKLLKERQTFDMLVADFRKAKEETENRKLARGEEDARAILENIKPKLAKELILKMIAADEKDEVVAILSAMPIGKQKKIIEEFKEDDELRKFDDILRRIREKTSTSAGSAMKEPSSAGDLR
jgi:predicted lipid-binding transport protein (Tim44 family)